MIGPTNSNVPPEPRVPLALTRASTGLVEDYGNQVKWWQTIGISQGLEGLIHELRQNPSLTYSERFPEREFPDLYTADTRHRIEKIDLLVAAVNRGAQNHSLSLEWVAGSFNEIMGNLFGAPRHAWEFHTELQKISFAFSDLERTLADLALLNLSELRRQMTHGQRDILKRLDPVIEAGRRAEKNSDVIKNLGREAELLKDFLTTRLDFKRQPAFRELASFAILVADVRTLGILLLQDNFVCLHAPERPISWSKLDSLAVRVEERTGRFLDSLLPSSSRDLKIAKIISAKSTQIVRGYLVGRDFETHGDCLAAVHLMAKGLFRMHGILHVIDSKAATLNAEEVGVLRAEALELNKAARLVRQTTSKLVD